MYSEELQRLSVLLWLSSLLLYLPSTLAALVNLTNVATPFSALGCPTATASDGGWIWEAGQGVYPSCDMPVRGDIAGMCVDANGVPDHTSIFVQAQTASDRSGCYAWRAAGCSVNLRAVASIEFDFDVSLCGRNWAAPLWMSPSPWLNPAAFSGEIDFVEGCPVGTLYTNFATGGDQQPLGPADGLNGPKHLIMTLEDSGNPAAPGNLWTSICDLGGINCRQSAYYKNFLSLVASSKGKLVTDPYVFLSDIWNGHGGDAGWWGCHAKNDPHMQCSYAIRNIRIHTNSGGPMFNGKCAALNANIGPGPSPPPPAPLPGWVKHSQLNCYHGHGAETFPGDDPNMPFSSNMNVAQCQAACLQSPVCSGIVVPSNGLPLCFRRTNLVISLCLEDPGYDFYERKFGQFEDPLHDVHANRTREIVVV